MSSEKLKWFHLPCSEVVSYYLFVASIFLTLMKYTQVSKFEQRIPKHLYSMYMLLQG